MEKNYGKYQPKKTFYNGVMFDSVLESKVAEALDELGIEWRFHEFAYRDKAFPYGSYTPDFVLGDGRVVEVAGVWDDRHDRNARVLAHILRSRMEHPALLVIDGNGDTYGWYTYVSGGEEYADSFQYVAWGSYRNIFEAARGA